jgi:hypothetical protein
MRWAGHVAHMDFSSESLKERDHLEDTDKMII